MIVADVVGRVECDNNPAALRFESGVMMRAPRNGEIIHAIVRANRCNVDTARMIYSTSWGEFQIMGFNLYSQDICGYKKNVAAYLVSSPDQQATLDSFLTCLKIGIKSTDDAAIFQESAFRVQFARAYNGPGNVEQYSQRILGALNDTI